MLLLHITTLSRSASICVTKSKRKNDKTSSTKVGTSSERKYCGNVKVHCNAKI